MASNALDGIRVLALENFIAGPYASMWLADAGADVIKIERPDGGDQSRRVAPLKIADGEPRSLSFLRANRNKRSLALDIRSAQGRELFLSLVEQSDVVLDSLNPTALDRLGLGYKPLSARNPKIIYVAVSGFGQPQFSSSPMASLPAFDIVAQALSGLMYRPEGSDERPLYLGFPLADVYASTLAVAGTYQALFKRERTGEGCYVDIALHDGCVALNELSVIILTALGVVGGPGVHALAAPFGAYHTRDGYVALGVMGEAVWERFVDAIDQPELRGVEEFANGVSRHTHGKALAERIAPWLECRSTDEVVDILNRAGVPASPVLNVDAVVESPQVAARGMLIEIDDPSWGKVRLAGNPIKGSANPILKAETPPTLGQHTDDVLGDLLSLDPQQIESLRADGVVK